MSEDAFFYAICRWLNKKEDSGMGIVEITTISGHEILTNGLLEKYQSNGLKKVERSGKKIITYWNEVYN